MKSITGSATVVPPARDRWAQSGRGQRSGEMGLNPHRCQHSAFFLSMQAEGDVCSPAALQRMSFHLVEMEIILSLRLTPAIVSYTNFMFSNKLM